MEDALVLGQRQFWRNCLCRVLILVLMEDALVQLSMFSYEWRGNVLILVLMEDALVP